jgi:hypothetical protein
MSSDEQLLCACSDCDGGLLQFYFDYLTCVKKLPASEVNHKTMSQRRTMEWGHHIIQHFIDTLFNSDGTVTSDGDQLVDVWKVANEAYFCDTQVAIWKKQMVARKLIDE